MAGLLAGSSSRSSRNSQSLGPRSLRVSCWPGRGERGEGEGDEGEAPGGICPIGRYPGGDMGREADGGDGVESPGQSKGKEYPGG